ncbi:SLC13 family permease [uncultured Ilyobacter sp.]|uniref:SLC13 family permease n=1 Tax=uncultured Ilyobacter sp. TaxID=544433 RepID=UPI0029C7241B|nr:SLC13 family permease [uncultured Ilyobacter sp.]
MISLLIIMAIVTSIALGYKTKINTGFFAMGFAYIIGSFVMGMKAKEVIGTWPIKIFFIVFAVSLFYNFAILNGTLEKLAQHLLYRTRKFPHLLPFAIFFAAMIIAALGAGYYSVLAFFGPITLILCEKTGLSKLTGALAVNYGCLAGSNFMTSASGVIFKGLIENAGYTENVFSYTTTIFATSVAIPIIVLGSLVMTNKKNISDATMDVAVPDEFNDKQKTNLRLIYTMVFLVLLVPVLNILIPGNETIKFVNSKMDIGLIAIIFSIIALMMGLGKQKEVVAKVPWETIIMICGVGMLISIAIKAGTIELLSGWIGTNIPKPMVPVALCIVGGSMSFFASTLGVVAPALFPIIPAIAVATGLNPAILFASIIVGAQATSVSPFSSGGSLLLGAEREEHKDVLFNQLLFKGAPLSLIVATVFGAVFSAVM